MPGLKAGGHEGEYLTDRLTDEAEQFIEQNKDRPFFLYFAHYAVHMPLQAKPAVLAKYKAKPPQGGQNNPTYAAMVESVDESVGRILRKLQALGIAERHGGGLHVRQRRAVAAGHLERAAAGRQRLSLRGRHPRAADRQVAGQRPSPARPAACRSAASISSPRCWKWPA